MTSRSRIRLFPFYYLPPPSPPSFFFLSLSPLRKSVLSTRSATVFRDVIIGLTKLPTKYLFQTLEEMVKTEAHTLSTSFEVHPKTHSVFLYLASSKTWRAVAAWSNMAMVMASLTRAAAVGVGTSVATAARTTLCLWGKSRRYKHEVFVIHPR